MRGPVLRGLTQSEAAPCLASWWPSSSKDFKVFSGVRSPHIWLCQAGRKLPLSQRTAAGLGSSGLAQGHRAAAEEVGKQRRPWPPAPCFSPGIRLQRVRPVWKTTAAPLRLCVVEKIGLRAFRNLTKQRHQGARTPAFLRGPLGVGLRVACSTPGLSAEPGLAAVPCLLRAVAMPCSAGEAPRQVLPQPAWPGGVGVAPSPVSLRGLILDLGHSAYHVPSACLGAFLVPRVWLASLGPQGYHSRKGCPCPPGDTLLLVPWGGAVS